MNAGIAGSGLVLNERLQIKLGLNLCWVSVLTQNLGAVCMGDLDAITGSFICRNLGFSNGGTVVKLPKGKEMI